MKNIAEDFLNVDIRKWHRQNMLKPGNNLTVHWTRNGEPLGEVAVAVQNNRLVFSYRNRWQNKQEIIDLAYTNCHFGGQRIWFRCACTRRVAILYLASSGFACRHCCNLNYETQHQELHNRLAQKAHKIRERLGWERGFLNGSERKPKGMHWSTFNRLSAKAECAIAAYDLAAKKRYPDYFNELD